MGRMGLSILFYGLFIGLMCIGAQWYMLSGSATPTPEEVARSRAVVFTLLCGLQLFQSLTVKGERDYSIGTLTRSPWLLTSFAVCMMAQVFVVSVTSVSTFFKVAHLTWTDLGWICLASSSIFFMGEFEKMVNKLRGVD